MVLAVKTMHHANPVNMDINIFTYLNLFNFGRQQPNYLTCPNSNSLIYLPKKIKNAYAVFIKIHALIQFSAQAHNLMLKTQSKQYNTIVYLIVDSSTIKIFWCLGIVNTLCFKGGLIWHLAIK